jgi:hypothetical protein
MGSLDRGIQSTLLRVALAATMLALPSAVADYALAQSQPGFGQTGQNSQTQTLQAKPQKPNTTRLPGVRIWTLEAITPQEAEARIQARPAAPQLVNPTSSAQTEMHLIAPGAK